MLYGRLRYVLPQGHAPCPASISAFDASRAAAVGWQAVGHHHFLLVPSSVQWTKAVACTTVVADWSSSHSPIDCPTKAAQFHQRVALATHPSRSPSRSLGSRSQLTQPGWRNPKRWSRERRSSPFHTTIYTRCNAHNVWLLYIFKNKSQKWLCRDRGTRKMIDCGERAIRTVRE